VAHDGFADRMVSDLPMLLRPGDVLVANDTRVIPAQLTARRGDARIGITLNQPRANGSWHALARNARRLHVGDELRFHGGDELRATVVERDADGGVVLAFTVGLASEDTSENAIAEVEMDNGRHTNPVFHGDTIYAESTVLEKRDADRPDAGLVKFKLVGKKPDGTVVVEIERTVLIKRKSHYLAP